MIALRPASAARTYPIRWTVCLHSRCLASCPISPSQSSRPLRHRSPLTRHGSTLVLPTSDTERPPSNAATSQEVPAGFSVAHFYFDSVFPITQGLFDPRSYLSTLQGDAPLQSLKKALPEQDKIGFGFQILGVESR